MVIRDMERWGRDLQQRKVESKAIRLLWMVAKENLQLDKEVRRVDRVFDMQPETHLCKVSESRFDILIFQKHEHRRKLSTVDETFGGTSLTDLNSRSWF